MVVGVRTCSGKMVAGGFISCCLGVVWGGRVIVLSVIKVGRGTPTVPPGTDPADIPTGTFITSVLGMFIVCGAICTVGPENELSTKLPKVAELLVLALVLHTDEFALRTMTGGAILLMTVGGAILLNTVGEILLIPCVATTTGLFATLLLDIESLHI
jgi:hypothetical protein